MTTAAMGVVALRGRKILTGTRLGWTDKTVLVIAEIRTDMYC
jgi:hypothetical protein